MIIFNSESDFTFLEPPVLHCRLQHLPTYIYLSMHYHLYPITNFLIKFLDFSLVSKSNKIPGDIDVLNFFSLLFIYFCFMFCIFHAIMTRKWWKQVDNSIYTEKYSKPKFILITNTLYSKNKIKKKYRRNVTTAATI